MEIRRSCDRLISTRGLPILARRDDIFTLNWGSGVVGVVIFIIFIRYELNIPVGADLANDIWLVRNMSNIYTLSRRVGVRLLHRFYFTVFSFSHPCVLDHTTSSRFTETRMSSFWRNFHHWLPWKLSKFQFFNSQYCLWQKFHPAKWQHFHFKCQRFLLFTTRGAAVDLGNFAQNVAMKYNITVMVKYYRKRLLWRLFRDNLTALPSI